MITETDNKTISGDRLKNSDRSKNRLITTTTLPHWMPKMTEAQRWACLWAVFLLSLAHVQTGSGLSTATDTESYEELLQAVKSGSFSLDGKGKDDAKAVLQQILDKSKY